MLTPDRCYPKPITSTRVSPISLLRPPLTCALDVVPGEPGVSRHRRPPEGDRRRAAEGFSSLPWPRGRPPGAPVAPSIRGPVLARSKGCHPALRRRTLVDDAEIASTPRSVKTSRLSRPGTPSLDERPSRAFPLACGFATTAELSPPLSSSSTHRGGVRSPATPRRSPCAPLHGIATTLTDFCNTNNDTRAHLRTPRTPLAGAPSGAPRPRALAVRREHEACGPAHVRDCSRACVRIEPW